MSENTKRESIVKYPPGYSGVRNGEELIPGDPPFICVADRYTIDAVAGLISSLGPPK